MRERDAYILKAKKFAEPPFQSKKIAEKVRKFGRHFWGIWGNFGSFLGHFGSFWVILGPCWTILGHLGSYLGHFGAFWVIFGPLRGIFEQICGKFNLFAGPLGSLGSLLGCMGANYPALPIEGCRLQADALLSDAGSEG